MVVLHFFVTFRVGLREQARFVTGVRGDCDFVLSSSLENWIHGHLYDVKVCTVGPVVYIVRLHYLVLGGRGQRTVVERQPVTPFFRP